MFIPNIKNYRKENKIKGKMLLIVDNVPTHPSVEVLNPINEEFEVMSLSPNVTPFIQPVDRSVRA